MEMQYNGFDATTTKRYVKDSIIVLGFRHINICDV